MLLVVFFALLCLASAQYASSSGNQDQGVEERLGVLTALLDNRERIESLHFSKIASLRDSANDNLGFANLVNAYLLASMDQEQYQQDARLAALSSTLAQINSLRVAVDDLTTTAESFREEVAEIRDDDKEILHEVACLANDDIARYSRIKATQERADNLNVLLDLYQVVGWENFRSLNIEELQTRKVVNSVNRQGSSETALALSPNSDETASASVSFDPVFVGAPNFNLASPIGFRIDNPHSYIQTGYPTIYFNIEEELWNVRTDLASLEMSGGNWEVDHVGLQVDNIYFDTTVYHKADLAPIVTSLFH